MVTTNITKLHGVGEAEIQGEGLVRYLQLHLHQEDSVMVGEDLFIGLFATPLIVFGALSGLWPLASGLWQPEARGSGLWLCSRYCVVD